MNLNTEDIIPRIGVSYNKKYKDYEIELKINEETSLNILIKKNNDLYFYESNFNENYLQQKFNSNDSINNIYNDICDLIDKKDIEIEENKNNLKLILKYNYSNFILIIEKSYEKLFEEMKDNKKKKEN